MHTWRDGNYCGETSEKWVVLVSADPIDHERAKHEFPNEEAAHKFIRGLPPLVDVRTYPPGFAFRR